MADRIPATPTNVDPYRVLDVPRDADAATISRAFRKLAKRFHPDRNPSPLGRRLMLVVNDAYDTLKSPERRAAYDRSVQNARGGGMLPPTERSSGSASMQSGQGGHASPPPPPAPIPEPIDGPIRRRAELYRAASEGLAVATGRARRLEWGRYAGRTVAEIAAVDPDYLQWFIRTPLGRSFAADVAAATGARG